MKEFSKSYLIIIKYTFIKTRFQAALAVYALPSSVHEELNLHRIAFIFIYQSLINGSE